eukprot:1682367-Amphidinium_carterae.1
MQNAENARHVLQTIEVTIGDLSTDSLWSLGRQLFCYLCRGACEELMTAAAAEPSGHQLAPSLRASHHKAGSRAWLDEQAELPPGPRSFCHACSSRSSGKGSQDWEEIAQHFGASSCR